jgi:eukaryotic-like serine/threonine-protein kinase
VPAVGDLLADRYRIDGVLGAGGMATVYLATDLRLERQVALKVLLPNLARDPSLAERFDREARILASVAHPNVAEVFDVERGDPDAGREPFYVMELCEGGSLAGRIEAGGPLEPGALVPIVVSVAAALGELHRRGLIHRDVKPANILFTGGRPKLADFGLAKPGGSPGLDTLTAPGTAIGTPAYMAPELVVGGPATVASDVYALAATTFHGLTGRAPRQADGLTTLATTSSAPPPRVSEVSPRLSGAFDDVVAAGLSESPADRPTLNAFSSRLVGALDHPGERRPGGPAAVTPVDPDADTQPIVVAPQRTRVPPAGPMAPVAEARARPRRRGGLPLIAAALALAFVAVGVLALAALSSLGLGTGQVPSAPPSTSATPGAVATESAGAPTPSNVATPSPGPTADPAAPAIAALGRVLDAIDNARGGHDGLNGGEAKELDDLALRVGSQLRAGDYDGARSTTLDLRDRVRKLKLDKKREGALLGAIDDLLAAIPG